MELYSRKALYFIKNKTRDGVVAVNFKQLKSLVTEAKKNVKEIKKYFKNKNNLLKIMHGNPQREFRNGVIKP